MNDIKQFNSASWFNESHSNGVELGLKELLFYKSKAHLLSLKPRGKVKSAQSGQYLAPHKGRGMEFAEVRQYQYGDDIRAIDWRVTARTGEAHTKLFQEEKERPVFVFCDFSSSMLFGSKLLLKSVLAAHLGILVSWAACQRGDRVGGVVFNNSNHHELKPIARDRGVLALAHQFCALHEQALIQKETQPSGDRFNENLKRLVHLAKPGSLIYLISDFTELNDESFKLLERATRHNEVIGCMVSDPFEHHLPEYSQAIEVSAGEQNWTLPLMDKQFRDKFSQNASDFFNRRLALLKRSGMSLQKYDASLPIELQIMRG
ncbi:DUF58 domain-containing protein [Pseudoalteromonas piscicida]|uniref:DUF58 domain-containing protein n=1 Tax=Pseudoalteromonas piscicida TaxID=43662 RepID=A0AAQ2ISN0_PSEO7|nr:MULTISPECIES: DUF58 domain-containing protein [Pseudoalteromonas]KJY89608.1 hypothetical protein TW75_09525 [Pseudoalteromonas piscicida]MDP4486349.1 DUF58 domain-containing protein [Pseudoalteromonas piscicida]TMN37211.1 DUF58 domain-containing protein [Pseudoalteromonas piscicida]TMN43790.1 DUF58 domain-containing protein [Pseudoalteromonas piscicida]TMN56704.1 DUF58 domain-containing protein [Pseudoalteromonas piscicida]